MPVRTATSKLPVFLDANAGAPLHPRVAQVLRDLFSSGNTSLFASKDAESTEFFSPIGNPSSIHWHGRQARRLLSDAREQMASTLGAKVDVEQIFLTSSGSEANQTVIRSVLEPLFLASKKVSWITSKVEHDSIRQMKSWVEERGGQVFELPVNSQGEIQVKDLKQLVQEDTALVSLVWVNNETGVISDIPAAGNILKKLSEKRERQGQIPLRFHVDGAQAWGKLPIDVSTFALDYLTLSSHKIGGLGGLGLIWNRLGAKLHPLILGHQEKGRRGGTENLLGIIAAGEAAMQVPQALAYQPHLAQLRDRLQNVICQKISGVKVNGSQADRVANTLNLSFEGIEGDGLVMALDMAGYSVSAGSACSSGVMEPSHVLLAMGLEAPMALAAIRVSLSPSNTWEELEGFCQQLELIIQRLRLAKERSLLRGLTLGSSSAAPRIEKSL